MNSSNNTPNINYGNLVINGSLIHPTTKVRCVVKQNPKRFGSKSHQRFEEYMNSTTVEDYFKNGGTRGDLRYDVDHEFFEIIIE